MGTVDKKARSEVERLNSDIDRMLDIVKAQTDAIKMLSTRVGKLESQMYQNKTRNKS